MSASTETPKTHWLRGGPVISSQPRSHALAVEGEVTAAIGDSAVLGLWAFATGTWIVGVIGGGYLPASDLVALAPTALFISGLAQFIAGLYAFPRANMFPATAFCAFGTYHVINATVFLLHYAGVLSPHNGMNLMSGFLDQSFGFIAFGLLIAILPANFLLILITATTWLGSCLLGIAEFHGGADHLRGVAYAGGALFFADAGVAYYLGMAMIVNASFGRELLPIFGEV
jgi:succinate-acetate transporter protein